MVSFGSDSDRSERDSDLGTISYIDLSLYFGIFWLGRGTYKALLWLHLCDAQFSVRQNGDDQIRWRLKTLAKRAARARA